MPEPSRQPSPALTGSEAIAATLVSAAAAVVVAAYLIDRAGGSFAPVVMLPIALVAAAGTLALWGRRATWERADLEAFTAIVAGTFAWLLWIARPSFFPLGSGGDLTHHLLLIQYIERHWRLVHVPGVEAYLGEMVHYTPGSQILVALAGAWSRASGLHALHAVMAATVALKTGVVFILAMRMLPRDVPRVPIAAIGAITLFASQTYFLGSFVDYSFVAQVVAEMFAVAMWWTLAAWDQEPGVGLMALGGLTGAALFLTWPIFVGPPVVVLGALVVLPHRLPFLKRIAHAGVASAPIALVAGLFAVGRTSMMIIAGTGGRAVWPSPDGYGWWFLIASIAGLCLAAVRRRARTTALFVMAIALQTAALYWFARAHANEPYMALKMFYLLLFPQAVAASLAVGEAWRLAARLTGSSRPATRLAWLLVAALLVFVARPLVGAPKSLTVAHHPATSPALEQAGEWARTRVSINCVEYLVADDWTAYWLHLAVLGNARQGPRTADNATYELTPSLVRWLTPGGLPFGIADLPALPSDIRNELDILAQFDTAAVVRRRGAGSCPAER